MNFSISKSQLATQGGARPPAAVELSTEGALAAATPGAGKPPVFAFEPLPEGAILPGIGEANLRKPEAVAAAVRRALDQVSSRTRAVTLVLPDTTIRVFVLDFDSLPKNADEVLPVLRFRLRKMVPFEVEEAGISYQVLGSSNANGKSEIRVLTAVIPGEILAEYEGVVRAAGYEPGAVLPSSLAALAAIDSTEAVLTANLGPTALTTCITSGQDLLLYRIQDLPLDADLHLPEVQKGIAVAAAYFEDRLGAPPTRLLYAGNGGAEEFGRWINFPELAIADLAQRPEIGAVTALGDLSLAGVTGALAGAA